MNSKARDLLADAIESNVQKHLDGNLFKLADVWDDLFSKILPIEDEFCHPTYSRVYYASHFAAEAGINLMRTFIILKASTPKIALCHPHRV